MRLEGEKPTTDPARSFPILDARALFVLLYVVALFMTAVRPTLDPDMWWHLRTGELILGQGVPHEDVFSFTMSGTRWVAHEWLSQALMWLFFRMGGFAALIVAFAVLITATFWLVYRNSAGKPYLAVFISLLAALASAPVWGARPQIFNMLFLALFLTIVERVRRGRSGIRAFVWLPLLAIVWANLHSGYLAGVALLVVYVVGDGVQRFLPGRWKAAPTLTAKQVQALALAAAGSFLAAALNPNTFTLWFYPFETLSSPSMQQFIQEWHPPVLRLPMFWPFAALLGLGVLGWAFGRRPSLADVLLFMGTGAAGLVSARNIPLFAVVAGPVVSRALASWFAARGEETRTRRRRPKAGLLALNFILLGLAVAAAGLWAVQTIVDNEEAIQENYPVTAVDFLEAEGLDQTRGYNDYGWGGYLIWRGLPVYVDGRADVYGDDFLFFYQQAALVQRDWREPLERFDVAYVLVPRNAALATMLGEADGWEEAYEDEQARIYVRAE